MPHFPDPESVDEAVYRVLEAVPTGRVTSYGAVASLLGLNTPRRPAAAMRRAPDGLPWWRMVRADGGYPESLRLRALPHWDDEGTPRNDRGVAAGAFWVPTAAELAAVEARVSELSAPDDEMDA